MATQRATREARPVSSTISGGSLPPIPNLGERVSSGTTDDRREFSQMAKWALRLSIAGLVVPLVGIAGLIMGIIAHRRDKREGRRYGYAKAAWIIPVVGFLLGIIIAIAAPSEASTSTPLPPRVERLQAAPDPAPVLEPEAKGGVTRRQARDLPHSFNDESPTQAGLSRSGSDGTRTRGLRIDSPVL